MMAPLGKSVSPLLKLEPVGAQFKEVMSAPVGGTLREYYSHIGYNMMPD